VLGTIGRVVLEAVHVDGLPRHCLEGQRLHEFERMRRQDRADLIPTLRELGGEVRALQRC
jgi:hypothetical protein